MRSSAFYRHDTYSNVWQTLLSPTYYNTTTVLAMHCQLTQGTRGRILEQISTTKFRLPYLAGGTALVNEEISITYGPGAQETRTITISEDPTTHDSGIITTGAAVKEDTSQIIPVFTINLLFAVGVTLNAVFISTI